MLGRPCAWRTVSSGSNPCWRAQMVQMRAPGGVESARLPSRSKSTPLQVILVMREIIAAECRKMESSGVDSRKQEKSPAASRDYGSRTTSSTKHHIQSSPGSMDCMMARLLPLKCLVTRVYFDASQHT